MSRIALGFHSPKQQAPGVSSDRSPTLTSQPERQTGNLLSISFPSGLQETATSRSVRIPNSRKGARNAPTLSPELRQAIQTAGEEPVRLADTETQTEYVILKADLYDRMRALADDARAAYPLAVKVFGEDGGDDARIDEYNPFDPLQ